MKIDITTNTILQLVVLGVILYYAWSENTMVVVPIFVGTTYVAYTFNKNLMTSLIMAAVISYTLMIVLYKDHRREMFRNQKVEKTEE